MTDATKALARELSGVRRELRDFQRTGQIAHSTITVDGETKPVVGAIGEGVKAAAEIPGLREDLAAAEARVEQVRAELDAKLADAELGLEGAGQRLTEAEGRLTDAFGRIDAVPAAIETARSSAVSTAASDATTKANNARTSAISTAATDASTKASAAQTAAVSAAAADAKSKADAAQAAATAAAAADAKAKADAAQAAAIAAAAADATTKANAAKAAAAQDATDKANAARSAAIVEADAAKAAAAEAKRLADAAAAQSLDFVRDPQFQTGADSVKSMQIGSPADARALPLPNGATGYGRVTGNDNWTQATSVPAVAGRTYRLAVDVRAAAANTAPEDFDLMVWWLTSDGASANTYSRSSYPNVPHDGPWQTMTWEYTVPASPPASVFRASLRAASRTWLVTNFHVLDVTEAKAAQSKADAAATAAAAADTKAANAATAAQSAQTRANEAHTLAGQASDNADASLVAASGAADTANTAKATADSASSTASTAKSTADTAKTTADGAASTAATAKSTADTAKSTADTAKSTADGAKTTADGRPRILFSTAAPSGTAPQGSTWFRVNGSQQVVGQWQQTAASNTGSTWTSRPIHSDVIANLDVGKLTAGSAVIIDAVIQKIAAQTATIQRADIANLFVTAGATMSQAVIDELYSRVVRAKLITATEQIIAPEAIVGLIKANKIDLDSLNGQTITGATIRTAASGRRVQLAGSRLDFWDENDQDAGLIYGVSGGSNGGLIVVGRNPEAGLTIGHQALPEGGSVQLSVFAAAARTLHTDGIYSYEHGSQHNPVYRGTTAQRDAAFPGLTGVHSGTLAAHAAQLQWYNIDTGWTEQFYSATNGPTGAGYVTVSGWYPVSGALPFGRAGKSGGVQSFGSPSMNTLIQTNSVGQQVGGLTYSASTDRWRLPVAGTYRVRANGTFTNATTNQVQVAIVNSTGTTYFTDFNRANGTWFGVGAGGTRDYAAGTELRMAVIGNSITAVCNPDTWFIELEYVGPPWA